MSLQSEMEEMRRLMTELQTSVQGERIHDLRQRLEGLERLMRKTTLREYIEACHSQMFLQFQIEPLSVLRAKGLMTSTTDKVCPEKLEPWAGFTDQLRVHFDELFDGFPTEDRLFPALQVISGIGEEIEAIANENMLQSFIQTAVRKPVQRILGHIQNSEHFQTKYSLGSPICFIDYMSSLFLTDPPATTPNQLSGLKFKPDKFCIFRPSSEGVNTSSNPRIMVEEAKAPHKLTTDQLRAGLRTTRSIYEEVVQRRTIPTKEDPEALFEYNSEKVTAAAIIQTYNYMIKGGVDYGILTNGEAMVFLMLKADDPSTLLYHLSEPKREIAAGQDVIAFSAVGQCLSFIMMILSQRNDRQQLSKDTRRQVVERLNKCATNFEMTSESIPESDRSSPSGDSISGSLFRGQLP
ncbi:hypothetical protein NOR_06060 [Metarhizium rileyi]|uniref:Uncharacterized protein n=1 Tax=Metarhizium rileyi (strain RCEF 4871) TaxID=1649241 RepID=A0A167BHZ1_METRR|nr:hypothetical protein NOR_06060 [Metarhizium rileyi RCEF 4871]